MFKYISDREKKIEYSKRINIPAPQLTIEVQNKLNNNPAITPLELSDANKLILDTILQNEIGFTKLPSGGRLVAMKI